eukprot:759983-Hanusia_phi.AAC.3
MGIFLSKIFGRILGNKEVRILILGLDNAGKTTILYRLHQGEVVTTIPSDLCFEESGQSSIRPYWRCYYPNTNAIIYVVDSADQERINICKDELLAMLDEDELKDAALCVFANKQDLPGAMSAAQVSLPLISRYSLFADICHQRGGPDRGTRLALFNACWQEVVGETAGRALHGLTARRVVTAFCRWSSGRKLVSK